MFNSRIWTDDDTSLLLKYIGSKKKIEEIARLQKRSVAMIESKLKTIAAKMYFNEHLPYDEIEEKTGIKKDSLVVKRAIRNSELSGSPKDKSEGTATSKATSEAKSEATSEVKSVVTVEQMVIPIQIITYDNPFTLDSISTLLISSVSQCLLTPT